MTVTSTTRTLDDGRGAVRVDDLYDTDIDDLWQACTSPDRLARWVAEVSGDLRVGGTVTALFTSTADTTGRIEVCDAPHHLLVVMEPGSTTERTELEAWLTTEGSRTRLVIEERGLPADSLHFYTAGWQTHLEDLATSLSSKDVIHPGGWSAERPSAHWHQRWTELLPAHRSVQQREPGVGQ